MRTLFEYIPRILSAFKKRDQRRLRKLNDSVLRETAIDPTKINFRLAIISYVLSKIVSKPRLLSEDCQPALSAIEYSLLKLVKKMRIADERMILDLFSEIETNISLLEDRDPRFVIGLLSKGKLKMSATFYAQGMSLGVAAEMTGIDKQEILDYAGSTMMFDRLTEEKTLKERMKIARQLLSG
ncbi:MAG: hypothetical protein ABH983_00300 [Candidatus Micrarchaeota archaeon]|nr:hypothetical protein [Candidatus Micrarchaeota archaeon]MBU1681711.1 hypothetical protein [Candidatus Micrarchaeota archaeon]